MPQAQAGDLVEKLTFRKRSIPTDLYALAEQTAYNRHQNTCGQSERACDGQSHRRFRMAPLRRRPCLRDDARLRRQKIELLRGFQEALLEVVADHPIRLSGRFEIAQYAARAASVFRIVIAEIVKRGFGGL